MKHRGLTSDGDWLFGKGLASIATDEAAVELNIKTRVLSWVGDCFFALDAGVDWRARLDVNQQAELEEEVKAVILQSFGVVGINTLTTVFDPVSRRFTLTYAVQTIYSASFQQTINQIAGV